MIDVNELSGAVLAGGRSLRMGRDKARLTVDGTPLWERQVGILRAAGAGTIGIVRRPGQLLWPVPPNTSFWFDTVENVGPLAGVHAALAACRTRWLAIVAVDLPRLDAAWFRELATKCGEGKGAVPQHPSGAFEPLAAIYPVSALDEAARRLGGTDHSLQSFAEALCHRGLLEPVPTVETDLPRLANWNRPQDLPLP